MIRRSLASLLLGIAALLAIGASSAVAAPVWSLDIHHNETNFAPGTDEAQYWLEVTNVGDGPSSGPVTMTISPSRTCMLMSNSTSTRCGPLP